MLQEALTIVAEQGSKKAGNVYFEESALVGVKVSLERVAKKITVKLEIVN